MSKTFPEKILRKSTKISISVFPRFFLFYRVFRCFLVTGVKRHYRKRFAKKLCRKVFQKNRQKNPKPIFSRFFFITFLGVSRWGELKNTIKKSRKKIWPTLVLFWPPRNQPTTPRSVTFFFECPLRPRPHPAVWPSWWWTRREKGTAPRRPSWPYAVFFLISQAFGVTQYPVAGTMALKI